MTVAEKTSPMKRCKHRARPSVEVRDGTLARSLCDHTYSRLRHQSLVFTHTRAEDWNARFQRTIQDLKTHGKLHSDRMRIYSELSNLAQDFIHCAKTYGRIIISEGHTPYELKTIKPAKMGGFAGGDKYLVNNIMFKFAVDSKNLFDSDEAAIKVAGHELYVILSLSRSYLFL